jgi:hypothetical protein
MQVFESVTHLYSTSVLERSGVSAGIEYTSYLGRGAAPATYD